MAFKNYDEFPAPKPVRIPIGDKTYSFPGTVSARAWLLVEKMASYLDRVKLAEARGEDYDPGEEALDDLEYADLHAEARADRGRGNERLSQEALLHPRHLPHARPRSRREGVEPGGSPGPEPGPATRASKDVTSSGLPRWIDSGPTGPTWHKILGYWSLIQADFQEHYHLDLTERLLRRKSAGWLKTRIEGLLYIESRLQRILYPPKKKTRR
jgi:hypothetical protein